MKSLKNCILILLVLLVILVAPVSALDWKIDNVASSGSDASMALDSVGNPHIAYLDSGILETVKWTGSAWETKTIPTYINEGACWNSPIWRGKPRGFAVDAADNIHASIADSCHAGDQDDLYYIKWNGAVWETSSLGAEGSDESGVALLAVNTAGTPYIDLVQVSSTDAISTIIYWTGSTWEQIRRESFPYANPNVLFFAVDAASNLHLAYYSYDINWDEYWPGRQYPRVLTYAIWTGSAWESPDIPMTGVIVPTSAAADAEGTPSIIYTDSNGLEYAKWSGSAWEITNVAASGSGTSTSLALDAAGTPHIAYTDFSGVEYATWTGSTWEISNVGNGILSSFKLDADGNPHILYNDGAQLKYAVGSINEPPIANFTATPRSGTAPLTVQFTDMSLNTPTGWTWYFGDENYSSPWTRVSANAGWSARWAHSSVVMPDGSIELMGGRSTSNGWYWNNDTWLTTDNGMTWTLMNASCGWSKRAYHTNVVLPDGSIVLMGGEFYDGTNYFMNDVWRSTDKGATWTLMNASAGWTERYSHSSVALPDGSIVLMGGAATDGIKNDVWRSTDKGATWTQLNTNANWPARYAHSSVVMPDGSIVLMGGTNGNSMNDVWRSTDKGTTWELITASADWPARYAHSSVVTPDGSIALIAGVNLEKRIVLNDVWRSTDKGTTWEMITASAGWAPAFASSVGMLDGSIVLTGGQEGFNGLDRNSTWRLRFQPAETSSQNPSHTYTTPGIYSVLVQVSYADGSSSTRKIGYIIVKTPIESVPDLISKVDELGLPSGIENSLMAKLSAAQKQITTNKNTPARNQLQAFINEVNVQRGKSLTTAQANDLIATAQRIINAIPGK